MSRITEVSVIPFHFDVKDLGLGGHAAMGVSNLQYEKVLRSESCAMRSGFVPMTV